MKKKSRKQNKGKLRNKTCLYCAFYTYLHQECVEGCKPVPTQWNWYCTAFNFNTNFKDIVRIV